MLRVRPNLRAAQEVAEEPARINAQRRKSQGVAVKITVMFNGRPYGDSPEVDHKLRPKLNPRK